MSKFIKSIPLLQFLTGSLRFKSKSQCKPKPPKKPGKKNAKGEEASSPAKLFRSLSLFGAIPAVIVLAVWVFTHIEEKERPEFKKYEYLRIRHKRFAWGDGTKSLFHNPHYNPLVDGYEDELEKKEQEKQEKESLEQESNNKKKK